MNALDIATGNLDFGGFAPSTTVANKITPQVTPTSTSTMGGFSQEKIFGDISITGDNSSDNKGTAWVLIAVAVGLFLVFGFKKIV